MTGISPGSGGGLPSHGPQRADYSPLQTLPPSIKPLTQRVIQHTVGICGSIWAMTGISPGSVGGLPSHGPQRADYSPLQTLPPSIKPLTQRVIQHTVGICGSIWAMTGMSPGSVGGLPSHGPQRADYSPLQTLPPSIKPLTQRVIQHTVGICGSIWAMTGISPGSGGGLPSHGPQRADYSPLQTLPPSIKPLTQRVIQHTVGICGSIWAMTGISLGSVGGLPSHGPQRADYSPLQTLPPSIKPLTQRVIQHTVGICGSIWAMTGISPGSGGDLPSHGPQRADYSPLQTLPPSIKPLTQRVIQHTVGICGSIWAMTGMSPGSVGGLPSHGPQRADYSPLQTLPPSIKPLTQRVIQHTVGICGSIWAMTGISPGSGGGLPSHGPQRADYSPLQTLPPSIKPLTQRVIQHTVGICGSIWAMTGISPGSGGGLPSHGPQRADYSPLQTLPPSIKPLTQRVIQHTVGICGSIWAMTGISPGSGGGLPSHGPQRADYSPLQTLPPSIKPLTQRVIQHTVGICGSIWAMTGISPGSVGGLPSHGPQRADYSPLQTLPPSIKPLTQRVIQHTVGICGSIWAMTGISPGSGGGLPSHGPQRADYSPLQTLPPSIKPLTQRVIQHTVGICGSIWAMTGISPGSGGGLPSHGPQRADYSPIQTLPPSIKPLTQRVIQHTVGICGSIWAMTGISPEPLGDLPSHGPQRADYSPLQTLPPSIKPLTQRVIQHTVGICGSIWAMTGISPGSGGGLPSHGPQPADYSPLQTLPPSIKPLTLRVIQHTVGICGSIWAMTGMSPGSVGGLPSHGPQRADYSPLQTLPPSIKPLTQRVIQHTVGICGSIWAMTGISPGSGGGLPSHGPQRADYSPLQTLPPSIKPLTQRVIQHAMHNTSNVALQWYCCYYCCLGKSLPPPACLPSVA